MKDMVAVSYGCDACKKTFTDKESYEKHVGMNCIELYELSLDWKERNQMIYADGKWMRIGLEKRVLKAEKCVDDDNGGNLKRDWYFGEKSKRNRRRIMGVSRNELFSSVFMTSEVGYNRNKDRKAESVKDYDSCDTACVFFMELPGIADALGRMIDGMSGYAEKYTKKVFEKIPWCPYRTVDEFVDKQVPRMLEPVLSDWDNIRKILCEEETSFSMECSAEDKCYYKFGSYDYYHGLGLKLNDLKKTPFSNLYCLDKGEERREKMEEEKREQERRLLREYEKKKKESSYKDTDWFLVKIKLNWADEIDFNGFEIINGAERKEFEQLCAEGYDGMSIVWGKNEDGEYDSNDFEKAVRSYKKISKADKMVFERHGMMSGGDITYSKLIGLMQEQKELLSDEENEEEEE